MNERLHEAMVNFQYLEFMLNGAIKKFEQLIEFRLKGILNYQVNEVEINKMALGKLADRYATLTGNREFKTKVDSIIQTRNKLAHRFFLIHEIKKDSSETDLTAEVEDLFQQSELAATLADDVVIYTQHFYFDRLRNEWKYPNISDA